MSNLLELTEDDFALIRAAAQARENAYAPYSQFAVGAAIRTADGAVFAGCNVENVSYGLTVCAERNAVAAAVAAGKGELTAIAIVTGGDEPSAPCGACRQVLAEFSPEMTVIMSNPSATQVRRLKLSDLLPWQFTL